MIRKISIALIIVLSLSLFAGVALGEPQLPPRPNQNIYIQDYGDLIDVSAGNEILRLGMAVDQSTTAQLVVVTVDNLQGYSIEEYSTALFRKWGIGSKEKNNGILILLNKENILANQPGKVRIEVGYGLEGAINDAKAGRIIDTYIIPNLKNGNLSNGVLQAYQAVAGEVGKEYGVTIDNAIQYQGDQGYADGRSPATAIKISPFKAFLIALGVISLILLDFFLFGGNITSFILGMLFASRWGGGGGS
jgi:uncharacterized protein